MQQPTEICIDTHATPAVPVPLEAAALQTAAQCSRVTISRTWSAAGELFLVASIPYPVDASHAAAGAYGQIAETLRIQGLAIVHERVFVSSAFETAVLAERSRAFLQNGIPLITPVTCIQGQPAWGEGLAGIMIQAVTADRVRTVLDGGIPCGRAWRSNGAEYLLLQNITGLDADSSEPVGRDLQVRRLLERVDRILRRQGGSYRDVIRTWFYLADILDWYADFNRARSSAYDRFGIMPGSGEGSLLLPASTGIRGTSSSGAAATLNLLAVTGDQADRPVVRQLTNRGQLDAFRYGAAFSRGALVEGPAGSMFQLSGTAAIDEGGRSLFPGDIRGQITCTLDKVAALMAQAGAGLQDICAATVFVKRPEHAGTFQEIVAERGLAGLPAVCVVADICREELLFEIDAEALITGSY